MTHPSHIPSQETDDSPFLNLCDGKPYIGNGELIFTCEACKLASSLLTSAGDDLAILRGVLEASWKFSKKSPWIT